MTFVVRPTSVSAILEEIEGSVLVNGARAHGLQTPGFILLQLFLFLSQFFLHFDYRVGSAGDFCRR